jgi:hypothetical protein
MTWVSRQVLWLKVERVNKDGQDTVAQLWSIALIATGKTSIVVGNS